MTSTNNREQKNRSGNYQLVRICINEIQAMKKLGLGRGLIHRHLEQFFGTRMSLRQLSSNIYRVETELEEELKSQQRQDKIAELVKNPTLIQESLITFQRLTNPSSIPLIVERKLPRSVTEPASQSAVIASKGVEVSTAQQSASHTVAAGPSLTTANVSEQTLAIWESCLRYIQKCRFNFNEKNVPAILTAIDANPSMYQGLNPNMIYKKLEKLLN